MIPDLATSLLQAANHSDWTVEAERIVIGTPQHMECGF